MKPLKIKTVEFERAAPKAELAQHNKLPQIAIAGRSNVGKSSFINTLVNQRNLARTSRTPGRTREIILFRVNDAFYFADLPGYGYAKVARGIREEWGREIENYLATTESLMGVALLMDIRRDLRPDDRDLLHWLADRGRPVIPIITKVDKFAKNKAKQRLDAWERSLRGLVSAPPVGFSTTAGLGSAQTLDVFAQCLRGELKPASLEGFEQIAG